MLSNLKVVVIGGAGFIGSHIIDRLMRTDVKKVTVIDDLSTGKIDNIYPHIESNRLCFRKGDFMNPSILEEVIKDADVICHQGGLNFVTKSYENPLKYVNVNISGFVQIMELAVKHKVSKVIYASSSSVYGDSNEFPSNEKN